jgi:hypothetical protein
VSVQRTIRCSSQRAERGYALLLVVFLTAILLVATMTAGPRILIEGRREKETEMIWRGKQYVRGVKLYYRKLGRFPTSLEDLTKPQVGSLHFMREAYKDPMNKKDGSWRLIYVGPAGNLIGSLKPQQTGLQFPGAPGLGTPAGALGSINPQAGGIGSPALPGSPQGTPFGGTAPGTPTGTTPTGTPPTGQPSGAANSQTDPMLVPPADSGSPSTIIGGNIIGVGSNVNERSLRVYEKAKNYKLFEFIWDPSKDVAAAIQGGLQPGNVPGGAPIGQPIGNPAGGQPNPFSPTPPAQTPQQPAPAPAPAPPQQ